MFVNVKIQIQLTLQERLKELEGRQKDTVRIYQVAIQSAILSSNGVKGFIFIFIIVILSSCHKTYDCYCTTLQGQELMIGIVKASKKKAKQLCAENPILQSSSNYTSCTIK
jgi:hypothetical protein